MTDNSWLDLPDSAMIESGSKLSKEKTRAPTMRKSPLGKSRTWASDGEYIWFRRKQANPETLKRHERFLRAGDYQHVGTQDDVEIYQLQPSSPFKRKEALDLGQLDMYNVRRQAALSACRRDWAGYVDALEELAGRIKGTYDPAFAKTVFGETLNAVENSIAIRGGPAKSEIDRELVAVRARRGQKADRKILLPV